MERRGDEVRLNRDEARSGSTPHIVRYVLIISITLAIVTLSAIWIAGAWSSSRDTGGFADTERAAAEMQQQE